MEDRERFYSRLSQIPGVETMPSIGDWILLKVERPNEVARRVSRRVAPGLITVPRHVKGAVRVQICDARTNEELLGAIRESVA
jgi:histidinol-phosphate/aromatic aminotransferase/cobyric acid decarboxylase-like protein